MNYPRLDELDLEVGPRPVSEGRADGVHWTIRAGHDDAGVLSTVVTHTCGGVTATFSVLDASLHNGQLLSIWVGRERDARPFLLLRAAPVVTHATAVLASGARCEVGLSPVVEDFRLRFGGVPLAEEDPLVRVELVGPPSDVRVIELWRPPRLVPAAGPVEPAPPAKMPSVRVPPARNG